MTKYIIIIAAVLFVAMGAALWILTAKLETANEKLGSIQTELNVAKDAIKEQNNVIDDMKNQNEIINRNLNSVNERLMEAEAANEERIKKTEEILSEIAELTSKEASDKLTNRLNELFDELSAASR